VPVKIRKVDGYQVSTPGGVKAKHTTKAKAERQRRLLQGVEEGWKPTGRKTHHHSFGGAEQMQRRYKELTR
jgi:hypothetical protein